jgi:hypothetical protein
MLFWRNKIKKVRELMETGHLSDAAALFLQHQLHEFQTGSDLARRLADRFVGHARTQAASGDFQTAWQDLASAERLLDAAGNRTPAALVHSRQDVLEASIESAEQHLAGGKPKQALRILAELRRQRILDSRADRIESLATRIEQAECLADQGRWTQAQQTLQSVVTQRPDLVWVHHRHQALAQQNATAGGLKSQLQSAMQSSRWSTARQVSAELLALAPHDQLAADALRRSLQRAQAAEESRDAATPHDPALSDTFTGRPGDTDANLSRNAARTKMNRTMLWVDGVGGFLLCADPVITVGRALPDAGIDIPIQGDLRRRHLRIARTQNDFVATPLADVAINGKPVSGPQLLQSGQQLTLGRSVKIRFERPHPLSASARLEVVSRHRTQPWSDGIMLVSDTIILGSAENAHIVCPDLESDVVLRWSQNRWSIRGRGNLEVDGRVIEQQSELNPNCRITADGTSLTLEALG